MRVRGQDGEVKSSFSKSLASSDRAARKWTETTKEEVEVVFRNTKYM